MSRVVNIGQLEIRYLVDGSERGGLGVFEITCPPAHTCPRRTAIATTKNASMC